VGVDWPKGADDVNAMTAWVRRNGRKREHTSVLRWNASLEMYRPLLSYDELGHILEGKPSEFYDQLSKLLGLEQLTAAIARLDAEVKRLKQPADDLKKARAALKPMLETHDAPRAATALAQVKKTKPDLNILRPLITQGRIHLSAGMAERGRSLAIFIPRATSDQSPFRFLVLDDPIQATDPSKIDGFLDVLTELAAHRQLIVFTHDDRFPQRYAVPVRPPTSSRSPARPTRPSR
jgi:hypothetical protein